MNKMEYVEELRLDEDWGALSDEELEEILDFVLDDLE